jgi:transposase
MVTPEKKRAVFQFRREGKGTRWIARAVGLARSTVQEILKEGAEPPPRPARSRTLDAKLERIRQLYTQCDRSLVRVAEELEKEEKTPVPYSTLTDFCRHHQLGEPRIDDQPSGRYAFGPGVEQQHDTSPMRIRVGGTERLYQATSLKLGYSKNRYLRFYRRFRRFECKDFHDRAFEFFEGCCSREVIDNTSVVIAHGTGQNAVVAPEMQAFAERYGFVFVAHEKGDANRSAKVERDFDFILRNFLKGRTFADDTDLNRQAEAWARKKNAAYDKKNRVWLPRLFEEEKAHMRRLPAYRPPACRWHYLRRVDAEGFVCLDGNRYSAPNECVDKLITLKETMDAVTLMDGRHELCVHARIPDGDRGESRLAGHGRNPSRRRAASTHGPSAEETWLRAQSGTLAAYVQGLSRLGGRRFPHQVRKLYALCHEYEVAEVERVIERAAAFGLYDATRLEGMLLQAHGVTLRIGYGIAWTVSDATGFNPMKRIRHAPRCLRSCVRCGRFFSTGSCTWVRNSTPSVGTILPGWRR